MKGLINQLLSISLKKKVLMGYIFMSFLIIGILGFIGINFMSIKSNYDSMIALSNDIQLITQLKADINGIRAAFLRMSLAKELDVWEKQEDVIAMYSEKSDENISELSQGTYRERIREMEKTWIPFKETINKELIPLVKTGRASEAINILGTVQAERSKQFMGIANEIIDDSRNRFIQYKENINKQIKATITTVIVVIIVLFSVAFITSFWFINRYVVGVLHRIGDSAEKVANGDLTIRVEAETGDEFGKLAKDVTEIIKTMRHVLRDVADKTVYILKEVISPTIFGKEVSLKIERDLERTTASATATEELSSTIGDIARNIHTVAKAAEKAADISLKGKKIIDDTVISIDEVNSQIGMASENVKILSESSKKIDEIVVMIKEIADQTNLLALNAAIEAARAGEQGRGFAVVADEVRKLAQRTTNATSEINSILSLIHDGTMSVTGMMDVAVDRVKGAVERARHLNESFEEINVSFQKVTDMVHQIVTATEEQSATVVEISTNLSGLADDSRKNAESVKEMMSSFNNFSSRAKEFLRLLDRFYDPKMKIGITKADYVMWLLRLTELLDGQTSLFVPEEFQPDRSRMGKWYYGEGMEYFGNINAFKKIEAPHKRLHEIGRLAYEASQKGDREKVKMMIDDSVRLVEEIFDSLKELEGS
ncbi:MAG: methyl-accepting chemotaxis protein [Thermodesulfovibrionales bacterium]